MTAHAHYRADFGPCPYCGDRIDAHADWTRSGTPPVPGSASICGNCGAVAIVSEALCLRRPTPREKTAIDHSLDVQLARGATLRAIAERKAAAERCCEEHFPSPALPEDERRRHVCPVCSWSPGDGQ